MFMVLILIVMFGGWELVSAAILFGASLYGFLVSEVAEEVVIAETVEEVAGDVAEEAVAAAAAGGSSVH